MRTSRWRSSVPVALVAVALASLGSFATPQSGARAATLVLLHGTISDIAGPSAATTVEATSADGTFDANTTTNATGQYSLHVPAGGVYLSLFASGSTAALDHVNALEAFTDTFTATADTQEDFTWPGPANAQVEVVDSVGAGVGGVNVNTAASAGGDAGTLSDGSTPIRFDYSINVPVGPILPNDAGAPALTCTTDPSGHCSLPTVIGTDTFFSTDRYETMPGDPSYPSIVTGTEAIITADPTPVSLTLVDASSTVFLDGTVSDVGGPAAGTVVTAGSSNGASSVATTDASGAYALHVFPGDVYLTFTAGSATLAVDHVTSLEAGISDVLSVPADTQEDFTWPGPATARVTILDSNDNAVVGATVNGSGAGGGSAGTLSDGTTPVAFNYVIEVPAGPVGPRDSGAAPLTCTTDAAGECSLPTVIGASASYATDPYETVPGDPSYPSLTTHADALISTDPTLVTLTLVDGSATVLLHGIVTDAAGAAAGTIVTATSGGDATSVATTDGNGAYAVHVLPGDVSLAFEAGTATKAVDHVNTLSAGTEGGLTIGSDTQEDFTWPGPATAQVTVVDATGHAVAGVTATTFAGGDGEAGTLSDGTTQVAFSFGIIPPQGPSGPRPYDTGGPNLTCLTDAAGHCSLQSVIGTHAFYTTDPFDVVPGDHSYPSLIASAFAQIDADPTGVTLTFDNLGSVASAGLVPGTVLAVSPDGTSITGMSNAAVAGNVLPNGNAVVVGALSYVVHVDPGGSADVKLKLPAGSAPTAVFKQQGASYVDVSSISTIVGDTITMHLVDGGLGDSDLSANGLIVDPIIPVRPPSGPPPQVSGFSPSKGPIGTVVTISGTGFSHATVVRFGGTNAASFTIASDKKITAVVAAGTTTGTVSVSGPGGTGTSAKAFQVTAPPVPVVSNFNPPKGPPGTVVTISGSGFTGATAVRFNGVNAASFVVMSDDTIVAVVAAGTSSGLISVTTAGGTGSSGKPYKVT